MPKEISWQAPEFPEHRKHPMWYLGFGAFMALVILYGAYTRSWTMVTTFALFALVGGIHAARKPRTIQIRANGAGIVVDGQEYAYQVIKKFWVIYAPDSKALYLETTAYINHNIRVELGDMDPNLVREFLARFLEEDLENRESLSDAIARKLRF